MAFWLKKLQFPQWPNLSPQEARKHYYIQLIYYIGIVLGLFYILKYTFQYHEPAYNTIALPILIFVAAWPYCLKSSRNLNLLAVGIFAPLCVYVTLMVYAGGALKSPGVFWMVSLPATASTLFGKRGVWGGGLFMALSIAVFKILEVNQLIPMSIYSQLDWDVERLLNLVTFAIYMMLTIQFFVRGEDRLIAEISASHVETENLLRIVIHDVAGPTNTIRTGVELWRMKSPEALGEDAELLERIDRASRTISAMLEKLRTIRSVQDGKTTLNIVPLSAETILRSVIQINHDRSHAKKIKVVLKTDEQTVKILGDEIVLTLVVFTNLLSNAIKFSNPESEIHLSAEAQNDYCIFTVKDFGIGMPQQLLNSLFDLRTPTTRKGTSGEKGTGYGMPLVKSYIDKMQGEITVESRERSTAGEEPSGTTVTIKLPLAAA